LLARGLAAAQERGPSDEQAAALERRLLVALGASAAIGAAVKAGSASAPTAAGAAGAAMVGPVPALALKVALVLAVAAGGGAVAGRVLRHHETAPSPARPAMPASRPLSEVGLDVPTPLPSAAPADVRSDSPRREAVHRAPPDGRLAAGTKHRERTAVDPLDAELRLIEAARAAAPYQPERALRLCLAHERYFPRGVMREEREAIIISALISVGRDGEARARNAAFVQLYPSSPYAAQLRERLPAAATP
jgi:hypothetical protein